MSTPETSRDLVQLAADHLPLAMARLVATGGPGTIGEFDVWQVYGESGDLVGGLEATRSGLAFRPPGETPGMFGAWTARPEPTLEVSWAALAQILRSELSTHDLRHLTALVVHHDQLGREASHAAVDERHAWARSAGDGEARQATRAASIATDVALLTHERDVILPAVLVAIGGARREVAVSPTGVPS